MQSCSACTATIIYGPVLHIQHPCMDDPVLHPQKLNMRYCIVHTATFTPRWNHKQLNGRPNNPNPENKQQKNFIKITTSTIDNRKYRTIIQSSQTSPNRNNHSEVKPQTIQLPNIYHSLKNNLYQPIITTVFSAPISTTQQQPLQL